MVERAKQLLMQQRGIDESQAHKALRKLSMDSNTSLPHAARSVSRMLGSDSVEQHQG